MVLLVYIDVEDLCRTECALDEELGVCGVVDHIDVLVAQFSYDTVHAATLHSHACSYRVDALVVALNGDLGSLSRHTCYALHGDESVGNLWPLLFEQALQEHRTCAAEDDFRVVVLVVHTQDDSLYGLSLAILVARNLLSLRKDKLVVLVVNEEHLSLPHLIDLSCDYLSHTVFVFVVEAVVLELEHL